MIIITLLLLYMSAIATASANQLVNKLPNYHWKEQYANWGGWMAGLMLGPIFTPKMRSEWSYPNSYEKWIIGFGGVWFIIYTAVLFSCYYTVYSPI